MMRSQWGDAAKNWALAAEDEDTGVLVVTATWMLAAVSPEPGDRILEIACGAGRGGSGSKRRGWSA